MVLQLALFGQDVHPFAVCTEVKEGKELAGLAGTSWDIIPFG
jgi:hypothetical protein